MKLPGRPTIRCLAEDLEHDWDDIGHRRLVTEGMLDQIDVPLHDLAHPVVKHHRDVFDGSDAANLLREGISGLSDPMWYKLKTGRWRGAVYVDPDGIAWLCAAGLRRGGEAGDFYAAFMEKVRTSGAPTFLPTDADRRHAKRERLRARLSAWEQELHRAGQETFNEAMRSGQPGSLPVTAFTTGAAIADALITVSEITENDDSLVDVTLEFYNIDWSSTQLVERAQEVVMLSICNEPTAWQPGHSADRQYFSLQSSAGLSYLVDTQQDDSRAGLPAEPQLSHYAKKELLLGSAIHGEAVATLCGVWLVQSRDAEQLPKCPTCEEIHSHLDA